MRGGMGKHRQAAGPRSLSAATSAASAVDRRHTPWPMPRPAEMACGLGVDHLVVARPVRTVLGRVVERDVAQRSGECQFVALMDLVVQQSGDLAVRYGSRRTPSAVRTPTLAN